MKELIIVGAGGFGRDVLYLAKDINYKSQQWIIKGFIDDNVNALDSVKCNYKVIGTIKDWVPKESEVFALGVASPKAKEAIIEILKQKKAKFVTLISPHAHINDFCDIGEGCCIHRQSTIGDNVILGNFVHIAGSMIGQDSTIGDFSTTTGFTNVASAYIGKRVFLGSHSVVVNGRKVGDDAFVSAGSIVVNNIKQGNRVFGVPARKIKI